MKLTRRAALATGIAATLPGLGHAAAPLAGTQAPTFFRYKVGSYELTAINDGVAYRPVEGMVRNAATADVQAVLGAAFMPTDKFTIPFTTLVVNTGSKLILIDTGNGDLGAPTSGTWLDNFRAAGFKPENVDTILISHFHGDHINGLRMKDGTARFPQAEIKVAAPEWDHWMDDGVMSRAAPAAVGGYANVRRVFAPIAKDVARFEWGQEVAPGITAVAAPGHTPGHTVFTIASGDARFTAMSDITNNTSVFVRNPDWQAIVDMDGEMARQTRRRMLDMMSADKMQVGFYHAPFPATGFIQKDGDKFVMVPKLWTPL